MSTRKNGSKKTTTKLGKREYQRQYMRDRRAQEKHAAFKRLIHELADLELQVKWKKRVYNALEHGATQKKRVTVILPFQLPEMYEQVAQSLFRVYHDKLSLSDVRVTVKTVMEACNQVTNLAELDGYKKALREANLQYDWLILSQKEGLALKELSRKFGSVTVKEEEGTLSDFWVNCMLHLQKRDYEYYPSKRAADSFVFPHGTFREPYQFYEKLGTLIHTLFDPEFLYHGDIRAWRGRHEEANKRYREIMEIMQQREEADQAFLDKLRPVITEWIHGGNLKEAIRLKLMQAYGPTSKWIDRGLAVMRELQEEGVKSKVPIIIKAKLMDEQDTQTLQQKWIGCMEAKSGSPDQDGRLRDTEDFDQAVQSCTYQVFRNTGDQPSEASFEKVKKFWEVGYWSKHSGIKSDRELAWERTGH